MDHLSWRASPYDRERLQYQSIFTCFFFFFLFLIRYYQRRKMGYSGFDVKENDVTALSKSFSLAVRTCSPPPQLMSRLLALSDGKLDWNRTRPLLLSLSHSTCLSTPIYISIATLVQKERETNWLTGSQLSYLLEVKENRNAKGYRVRVRAPWCFWPIWIIDPAIVNPPFYVAPNKKHYYYYYYLFDLLGRVIARDYRRCECVRRISELWSEREKERERLSSKWSYFLSY